MNYAQKETPKTGSIFERVKHMLQIARPVEISDIICPSNSDSYFLSPVSPPRCSWPKYNSGDTRGSNARFHIPIPLPLMSIVVFSCAIVVSRLVPSFYPKNRKYPWVVTPDQTPGLMALSRSRSIFHVDSLRNRPQIG